MYCSNCGKEIDNGATWCKHCGSQTDNSASSVSWPSNTAGPIEQNTPIIPITMGKSRPFLNLILVAVVVIMVGFALLLLAAPDDTNNAQETGASDPEVYDKYLDSQKHDTETTEETDEFESFYITVNMCEVDPENADIWQYGSVNLFSSPGSTTIVAKVPACQGAMLKVTGTTTYNGVEMYKVEYNGKTGWQTKRLLTGVE